MQWAGCVRGGELRVRDKCPARARARARVPVRVERGGCRQVDPSADRERCVKGALFGIPAEKCSFRDLGRGLAPLHGPANCVHAFRPCVCVYIYI